MPKQKTVPTLDPGTLVTYRLNGDKSASVPAEIIRQPDAWHVDLVWWSSRPASAPRCRIDRWVSIRHIDQEGATA
jgi:hypothetical protein